MLSQRFSDPPAPTSEQSSANNDEQKETDTPANMAERSATLKKLNTILQDPNKFVVDRNDPNCPLYSLTSFEELNLKPNLLKGKSNEFDLEDSHNENLYARRLPLISCKHTHPSYFVIFYRCEKYCFQCPSKIQSIALPKLLDNPPSKYNHAVVSNCRSNLPH